MMQAINLYSRTFCEADSYGIIASQLLRHLSGMGMWVNGYASGAKPGDLHSDECAELLARPVQAAKGAILLGYPTGADKLPPDCGPRIIVTMWESSRVPYDWIAMLNTFDAVITPSAFCRDLFQDGGVTVPIHTIPLGVNPLYQYQKRPGSRPLTFLAFMDRGRRKGGLVAQQAFLRAFGDSSEVRLILKMRKPRVAVQFTNANMETIQRDMTDAELYALYLSADVLIFPTMGEGWGLPPREFAATGGISLATNWSGTADDIDAWGWPIPYSLTPARWENTRFAGQGSQGLLGDFAHVDAAELAGMLRHVADNREQYRAEAQQKAIFAGHYSWQTTALRVLTVWQSVQIGRVEAVR